MKTVLLVWSIILFSACSNLGNKSDGIHECRMLAYKKSTAHSDASVNHIYNKCLLEKKNAREKQNKKENIDSFIDFIFDLFWPRKSS